MEEKNTQNCTVCKTNKSSFYESTNALMHVSNNQQFVFNICATCDTVFLTNPVAEDDLFNYYTENYLPYRGAKAWGKYSSFVEKSQKTLDQNRVNLVKKYLNKSEVKNTILDVGCGKPSFLQLLDQKVLISCTGIDFSDSGWKETTYNNLTLKKVSIEDFKTTDLFDIITLWHYLEHDYNPDQTIEKLYNSLKPGGKLIIEVPDYKSISAKTQGKHWQGWHSPRHISLFSKKSFSLLFAADKWNIIKHYRYGTLDAFTLWWLGKMEKKGINWSGAMATHFWQLVFLKVVTFPIFMFEKFFPLGIQILVLEKNSELQ